MAASFLPARIRAILTAPAMNAPAVLALALLGMPALPALARAGDTDGKWTLLTESGNCSVRFVDETIDDGIFFVDRGEADCGPDLGRVTGYAITADGQALTFYSTLSGTVETLGEVGRQAEGVFTGKLRDGQALRLEHASGGRGIVPTSASMGEAAEPDPQEDEANADAGMAITAQDCLLQAGGDSCADQDDIGPPEAGRIQTLTRMNLRDQGTTRGSSVIGQIKAGSCLPITFCAEDESGRLWCGVQTPEGGNGYLLKQDDTTVYARNSC